MNKKSNNDCYSMDYLEYNNGLLDRFIDATYIITMTNSPRIKNIQKQLKTYIPTKKIYILYNDGYKRCDKVLPFNAPPYDLTDAYFHVIKKSLENNFNNILILEDDFIFSDIINDLNIHNEIKFILDKYNNDKITFNLGPIPVIFYPNLNPFNNIYKNIFTTGAQSIIYNKNARIDIMKYYGNNKIRHWDLFITSTYNSYFYRNPLIYQTYPQTENQKYWVSNNKNDLLSIINQKIISYFVKLLNLDKEPEPGFMIIYNILFIINYLVFIGIFIVLLYFFVIIFRKCSKF
jgi:hypothetical protein